jgi:SAM-dependent methyltransferase
VKQTGTDTNNCLVCGGRLRPAAIPGLLACTACGFITADVRLADTELAALYGRDYFHGQEYHDYVAEEVSLRDNFRRRIATIQRYIPNLAAARLFEIGCAYGFFLDEIKRDVAHASGIDISADAVAQATHRFGVDARCGDYLTAELGQPTDLMVMWDTIEHLARPDLFLAKAARDLRPGGHIAITTGDIGSTFARFRGKGWRMIHPPTHLHYFSAATLRTLLERSGFEVVHLSHPGVTRNVQSALYIILALKMGMPGLFRLVRRLRVFDFPLTVNLFDIMFVIARRTMSP